MDDAHLEIAAVVGNFDDFRSCRLIFEPHDIAGEADDGRARFVDGIGRNDVETHYRALFAANLGDNVIGSHADDILDLAVRPLADADDAVARAELVAALGRTALDQVDDDGVFVFPRQLRADALQRERQPHIEGFRILRREIGGMRIGNTRHCGQIALERVLGVGLQHAVQAFAIAVGQLLADLFVVVACEFQAQDAVFRAQPPDLVEFGDGFGIRRVLAVDDDMFIKREIHFRNMVFDTVDRVNQPLEQALVVEIVDFIPGRQAAFAQMVVDVIAPGAEIIDVLAQKIEMFSVQHVDVVVEHQGREVVVDLDGQIVPGLQHIDQFDRGGAIYGFGDQRRVQFVDVERNERGLVLHFRGVHARGLVLR